MALNTIVSLSHANESWKGFGITRSVFTCPQAKHDSCWIILVASSKKRLTGFVQSFNSDSLVHNGLLVQKCLKNYYMLIKFQRDTKYVRLRFFSCPLACITAVYSEHERSTTSSKWLLPAVLNSTYCFPKLRKQQQGFTLGFITKLLGHGSSQFIAGDAFMFASYSYRRKLLQQ